MAVHIVLVEPEIPQNTGNIARTCAVTGSRLHLVGPLGFSLDDRYLKRAGLDYWNDLSVTVHSDAETFFESLQPESRLYLTTKRGKKPYTEANYSGSCYVLFGSESAGLPEYLMHRYPDRWIRIPMKPSARSLNLSNAAAVVIYEAMRQQSFRGMI
ncbi:MAG: tRNA (uridine(34)/cytosine(34)/5-carboxymethylaminomethyluridine(34)-2'-O)-methyltransferase TrmL [Spirochaetia bacterium]